MRIEPIASGSSGNCYFISDGETDILIECGIPVRRIKEALWSKGRRLSDISACLVSHAHGDHAKSAGKLTGMGIPIYMSPDAAQAAGLSGRGIRTISMLRPARIGGMEVSALDMEHDSPGTIGFVVDSRGWRLLYVTDTKFLKWRVPGVTHLMIEANYDRAAMRENVLESGLQAFRAKRVIESHMSIDAVLMTLERMDRSRLSQVWLIHLSGENAEQDFKRRAQEVCGCEVYVA